MKSLLISQRYFPPQVGGITRMIDRIARELGRDRICCLTGLPAGPGGNGAPDFPTVYRSPTMFSGGNRLNRALAWGGTLSAIVLREHPRGLLLATIRDALYGRRLKQWLGLPMVTLVYGNDLLEVMPESNRSSSHAVGLHSSDRVVAISRYTAALAERAGVRPNRIDVVYPGCDATKFVPRSPHPDFRARVLGRRSQDRVILTTGNLVARKGHDMVIRALPRVLMTVPNLAYLIVGDGLLSSIAG